MIRVIEVSKCVEFGEFYDGGILSNGQGPVYIGQGPISIC